MECDDGQKVTICFSGFFGKRRSKKHSLNGKKNYNQTSNRVVMRKCKDKDGLSLQSTTTTTVSMTSEADQYDSEHGALSSIPSFVTCVESESDHISRRGSEEDMSAAFVTSVASVISEDSVCVSDTQHTHTQPCECGHVCHYSVFDPEMPLITAPSVERGSLAEAVSVCRSLTGHWLTSLDRSGSLDAQFKLMGLSYIKRSIMNRLAVPLTLLMEDNDNTLHVYIHTPIGLRHMRTNVQGDVFFDDDPDCGVWEGRMQIVDHSVPWFCGGRTVRAMQQRRYSKKLKATQVETRCVLPDREWGKLMLFNFVMIPDGTEGHMDHDSVDRILKYVNDGSKEKLV